jgi:hypothetical protein
MADFTDGLTRITASKALRTLAADAEHLAVLEQIVAGWPDRERVSTFRSVAREDVRSPQKRAALDRDVRLQLTRSINRPDALTFGLRVSWHTEHRVGADAPELNDQQLDNYRPDLAIVRAQAWVIPSPTTNGE